MYGVFTHIYHKFKPNVAKYTIQDPTGKKRMHGQIFVVLHQITFVYPEASTIIIRDW